MKRPRSVPLSLPLVSALLASLAPAICFYPADSYPKRFTVRSIKPDNLPADSVLSRRDDNIDIDSVSEAEALLACRAYLQRKNRLGEWHAGHSRKEMRQAAKRRVVEAGPALVDDNDLDLFESIVTRRETFSVSTSSTNNPPAVPKEPAISPFEGFQTTWNGGPSGTRLRRSDAAKRKWASPDFRAKWYAQRWGHSAPKQRSKDKLVEERLRALKPETFLAHPAVSAMTEDEIADAIRIYMVSRQKLSVARSNMGKARRDESLAADRTLVDESAPTPVLLSAPETLAQKRQKRAEQAKLRYQKRLDNRDIKIVDASPAKKKTSKRILQAQRPAGSTPRDAMARINADLESGNRPSIADVELVLQAQRLSNRRQLLIRILRECFGLRGKCVPTDVRNPESDLTFVTSTPIELVGALVLHKLRETE